MQQQLDLFGELLPSYSATKEEKERDTTPEMEVDAEIKKRKLADRLTQLLTKTSGPFASEASGGDRSRGNRAGGKAKGKGKGKKKSQHNNEDYHEVLHLLASVTLQQADQLARIQMDTGFVLTLRNDNQKECMLPVLIKASTQWKTAWTEQPAEVTKPLRTTLFTLFLTELGSRAQKLQSLPESITRATAASWLEKEAWVYQTWNPTTETLEKDDSSFIDQVKRALLLVVEPANLMRFQAARRLTPEMRGPTVTFLVDTGLRTRADELHQILSGGEGLAAWQLVAARLRQQRLRRGPAVDQLSKWMAEH